MPSFSQDIVDNRVIIIVDVSREAGSPTYSHRALLDTGAQVSAISPAVVQALDLVPIATTSLTVASGTSFEAFQYHARIDIPIPYTRAVSREPTSFRMGKELTIAGLPYEPGDYAVILGMDFIGMFHLTIYDNRIILSN